MPLIPVYAKSFKMASFCKVFTCISMIFWRLIWSSLEIGNAIRILNCTSMAVRKKKHYSSSDGWINVRVWEREVCDWTSIFFCTLKSLTFRHRVCGGGGVCWVCVCVCVGVCVWGVCVWGGVCGGVCVCIFFYTCYLHTDITMFDSDVKKMWHIENWFVNLTPRLLKREVGGYHPL